MEVYCITKGGFGGIYKSLDQKKSIFKISKKMGGDSVIAQEALENEIEIYRHLKKCQGVCEMIGSKTDHDSLYLELERFDTDMNTFQSTIGFTLPEIGALYIDLLKNLQNIHKLNVIHCDIKSANILIQFGCNTNKDIDHSLEHLVCMRMCFCDFGLAQIGSSKGRITKGTDTYTFPLMIKNGEITPYVDIWSLGITILKLILPCEDWAFLTRERLKKQETFEETQDTINKIVSGIQCPLIERLLTLSLRIENAEITIEDIFADSEVQYLQMSHRAVNIKAWSRFNQSNVNFDICNNYPVLNYFKYNTEPLTHYVVGVDNEFVVQSATPSPSLIQIDTVNAYIRHDNADFFKEMNGIVKKLIKNKRFTEKYKMKSFDCFAIASIRRDKENGVILLSIRKGERLFDIILKDRIWGYVYESASDRLVLIFINKSFFVVSTKDSDLEPAVEAFVNAADRAIQ